MEKRKFSKKVGLFIKADDGTEHVFTIGDYFNIKVDGREYKGEITDITGFGGIVLKQEDGYRRYEFPYAIAKVRFLEDEEQ